MPFEAYLNNPYVQAFLDVLSNCEGTNDRYDVVFGGGRFTGNQHPHRFVRAAGYNSDAAGRYQFLGSTWEGLRRNYGFADFSPRNQDLGAIALIAEKGVLTALANGDLETTVRGLIRVWPSLPGGHQQQRNWDEVRRYWANDLAVRGVNQQQQSAPPPTQQPYFENPSPPAPQQEDEFGSFTWSEFFEDDFVLSPPSNSSSVAIVAVVGIILAIVLLPSLLE